MHDWYKNHLSGFHTEKAQKELHQYDLDKPAKRNQKLAVIHVPILKPENVGESMAIDEKYIAGEFYTLLTNNQTGKVAVMAATHKKHELDTIFSYLGDKRFDVKTLTRDLSQTYEWVGRTNFMAAYHVADKFHVIRQLFESLQSIRIFYRQELLAQQRKLQEQRKNSENESKSKPKDIELENGETHMELLARSIYLLYKQSSQWTDNQRNRAIVLFKQYPQIENAYHLAMAFRSWYSKDFICFEKERQAISDNRKSRLSLLENWYLQVDQANVPEMLNFKALVIRHQGVILIYFIKGDTNARAEALNSFIQKIISNNLNTRNLDFSHFRLKNYLS